MRPVFLYATAEGQTAAICTRLAACLQVQGIEADLIDLASQPSEQALEGYTHWVLAASIRYGHHQPLLRRFVRDRQEGLASKPSAFLSVNLTARKPEKNRPQTNPYVQKYLRRSRWQPELVGVFPGALRYSEYNLFNKRMIQLIMRMTGGSTDLGRDIEYTDWQAVDAFSEQLQHWIRG